MPLVLPSLLADVNILVTAIAIGYFFMVLCIKKGYPNLCFDASKAYFKSNFYTLRFPCPPFLLFSLNSGYAFVYVWVCSLAMSCFTYSWIRNESLREQSRKSSTIG